MQVSNNGQILNDSWKVNKKTYFLKNGREMIRRTHE